MNPDIDWCAAPVAIRLFVDWLERRGARLASWRQSSASNLLVRYELAGGFLVSILADRSQWFLEIGSAADAGAGVFDSDLWEAYFSRVPAATEPHMQHADDQIAFLTSMIENHPCIDWDIALPSLRRLRRERVERRLGLSIP